VESKGVCFFTSHLELDDVKPNDSNTSMALESGLIPNDSDVLFFLLLAVFNSWQCLFTELFMTELSETFRFGFLCVSM
jgi:hypothetical protein